MSSNLPNQGDNSHFDNNKGLYGAYRLGDSNSYLNGSAGISSSNTKGTRKPRFKPVVKRAAAVHKINNVAIPMVPTSVTNPIQSSSVENVVPKVETIKEEPKERKETRKDIPKRNERNQNTRQNRQRPNRGQPRSLVSGESFFFATNSVHRSGTNAMDNALLMSNQISGRQGVKKDEMDIEVGNDDHELTALHNGPIRFPYVKEDEHIENQSAMSWDEDEAQVSALDLLKEVNDGDMMLFALPSFLPIYAKNREYGINEDAFVHNNDTKPHDYISNELMEIPAGRIGKMRVHESGRISIDINGYIVDMNVSIPLRYQQQVVTIDDTNLTILGDVKHRLVLTPDVQNFQ